MKIINEKKIKESNVNNLANAVDEAVEALIGEMMVEGIPDDALIRKIAKEVATAVADALPISLVHLEGEMGE